MKRSISVLMLSTTLIFSNQQIFAVDNNFTGNQLDQSLMINDFGTLPASRGGRASRLILAETQISDQLDPRTQAPTSTTGTTSDVKKESVHGHKPGTDAKKPEPVVITTPDAKKPEPVVKTTPDAKKPEPVVKSASDAKAPAVKTEPATQPAAAEKTAPATQPAAAGKPAPATQPAAAGKPAPATQPAVTGKTAPATQPAAIGKTAPVTQPAATGKTAPVTQPAAAGKTAPVTQPAAAGKTSPTTQPPSAAGRTGPVTGMPAPGHRPNQPQSGVPIHENCISFDPRHLAIVRSGHHWGVMGRTRLLHFSRRRSAQRALSVLQYYGMSQQCFVGSRRPLFRYYLTNSRAPSAPRLRGEHCTAFSPALIHIRRARNGRWVLAEGRRHIFRFRYNRREASKALSILRKYTFNHSCYVGHGSHAMRYILQR